MNRKIVSASAFLIVVSIAWGKPADELPPLNARVLEFARASLGEKVGNGECTSLAIEAFKQAGARRFRMKPDSDYVWGEPVESFKKALPGDVVQFREAVFQGRSRINGDRIAFWRYEYPHHTAIISSVGNRGKTVSFLHQNIGRDDEDEAAKRIVKEETIRVDSLKPGGKVWIFRPIAAESAPSRLEKRGDSGPAIRGETATGLKSETRKP